MAADLLRPITDDDVPAVLGLNESHVELLAPLDAERLAQLLGWAQRADVILSAGEVAGFVITFSSGTAYDSANYRWFEDRYPEGFLYLDRIVVAGTHRRLGLARAVYEVVEADAAGSGRLTLEVNLQPPNEPSLAFHRGRGFTQVGRLDGDDGKAVSLMAKELG